MGMKIHYLYAILLSICEFDNKRLQNISIQQIISLMVKLLLIVPLLAVLATPKKMHDGFWDFFTESKPSTQSKPKQQKGLLDNILGGGEGEQSGAGGLLSGILGGSKKQQKPKNSGGILGGLFGGSNSDNQDSSSSGGILGSLFGGGKKEESIQDTVKNALIKKALGKIIS